MHCISQRILTMFVGIVVLPQLPQAPLSTPVSVVLIAKCSNSHKHSQSPLTSTSWIWHLLVVNKRELSALLFKITVMYQLYVLYNITWISIIVDEQSVVYPPSMIASACICAAMRDLTNDWRADLYARILRDITGVDLVRTNIKY